MDVAKKAILNQMKKDKERLRKLIELARPNQLPKLKSEEEKKDGAKVFSLSDLVCKVYRIWSRKSPWFQGEIRGGYDRKKIRRNRKVEDGSETDGKQVD